MSDLNRIGARIDRALFESALGFLPEVGESFSAGGLVLRVMARTVGVEPKDDGEDAWFDELFVATAEAVDDLDAAGERLREVFVGPVDAQDRLAARAESAPEAAPEAAAADERSSIEEALRREIDELLKAA